MSLFRVDDGFHSHPHVLAASPASLGLWLVCGSWSTHHKTAGFIPANVPAYLIDGGAELADELTGCGLWRRIEGGFQMLASLPAARGCPPLPLWSVERDDYRRKIPQRVREAVYLRDGFACVECGDADDLTLDHIHPWSLGGPDTVENLRVLCRPCNSSKGARI